MYKILIVSIILLSCLSPALADDLGFSDFIAPDALKELREAGVLDTVLFVVGLIVGGIVIAVVIGLCVAVGKAVFHSTSNNSVGKTNAIGDMFYMVGAVIVMVVLGGVFFYIWNGLA